MKKKTKCKASGWGFLFVGIGLLLLGIFIGMTIVPRRPLEDRVDALKIFKQNAAKKPSVGENSKTGSFYSQKYVDTRGVSVPTKFMGDGSYEELSLLERLRYLELKVNAQTNWIRNPRIGSTPTKICNGSKDIDQMRVCLDIVPKNNCVVYDLGIREQPQFGMFFEQEWGCEVHAFDPSPITVAYMKDLTRYNSQIISTLKNYTFHPIGASGIDGDLKLYEYSWGQISSIMYPYYADLDNCSVRQEGPSDDEKKFGILDCKAVIPDQKTFKVPVRTLQTMLSTLGHKRIDVLKIDIEGSEYAFLEEAFDTLGCLPVNQIILEFHHHSVDPRYGGGAEPVINALVVQMQACGLDLFHVRDENGGHADTHKWCFHIHYSAPIFILRFEQRASCCKYREKKQNGNKNNALSGVYFEHLTLAVCFFFADFSPHFMKCCKFLPEISF